MALCRNRALQVRRHARGSLLHGDDVFARDDRTYDRPERTEAGWPEFGLPSIGQSRGAPLEGLEDPQSSSILIDPFSLNLDFPATFRSGVYTSDHNLKLPLSTELKFQGDLGTGARLAGRHRMQNVDPLDVFPPSGPAIDGGQQSGDSIGRTTEFPAADENDSFR